MKKKSSKKSKSQSKKHTDELTYFLDHPDIHREPCVGNGSSPGPSAPSAPAPKPAAPAPTSGTPRPSIAEQINFGGRFKK